jgi:AmmeMemoRadiSam system protein A
MANALVELAKAAIEEYTRNKKILKPPDKLTAEMKERAGVFVSLKLKGELRGCIGTFAPTTENVASEIIHNAIEASTKDPRFFPLKVDELESLEITVDVLSEPVKITSNSELDAKKYGIIVKCGTRRGLLLPDLEGVDTPEAQVAICRRKAGIGEHEKVEIFKFEVNRYH